MKDSELLEIRALTREFVREMEFLKDNKFDFELNHFQRHLLIEVSLNSNIGISELAKILMSDKGNVSRAIRFLITNNYLTEEVSEQDRRRKYLSLTKPGKIIVKVVNEYSNSRLHKSLSVLSDAKLNKLISGIRVFNNALKNSRLSGDQ